MYVELLHFTPLGVCARAIRTCWDSHNKSDNGGECDRGLIERIGNINKHKSTLEHLVFSFEIIDISRACLQELARHRIASLSVKSSRYTLKELKKEESFNDDFKRAEKYIVLSKDNDINMQNIKSLDFLRQKLQAGISQDIIKYALPECYKTRLVWTINARSLQNFLELRTSNRALQEIRDLANNIFMVLPESHKYLFVEYIKK